MNNKKAGALFFTVIIVHIIVVAILTRFPQVKDNMSVALSLLLGELIIGIPTLIFLIVSCVRTHESVLDAVGFHKIKIGTIFIMILCAILSIPIALFANMVSMLFTQNVVTSAADQIMTYSTAATILCGGLIGPFVEEFSCRGVIFRGMKKEITTITAVILSALIFGFFHLNLNQFIYAFLLGIIMALAVEATGSIWASIIIHMTINTEQILQMTAVNKIMPEMYGSEGLANNMTREMLLPAIVIYAFIAGVSSMLVAGTLIWAAHHEGRLEALKNLNVKKEGKPLTLWFILGAAAAIAFIIFYEYKKVWS